MTAGRHPWRLVIAGGVVMGLSLGARHVQGLFLLPLTMAHDWPRDTYSTALALQNLLWGLAQPLAGMLADRWGSAKVIVGGLLLYALGLLGTALAATPAAVLVSAGLVVGLGLAGTSFGTVYGAVSRLAATPMRGWALGFTGAIGGVMQFASVPAVQETMMRWGWQAALLALAAGMLLVLPLAWPLRDQPGLAQPATKALGDRQPMSSAIGQALRHRGFWLLNLGFLACGFQLAFIATHLPATLLDRGLHPQQAATALALIALANVVGTYAWGRLGDLLRRKTLLTAIYLIRSAAMALFVMLPPHPAMLYAFALVMGFIWLGTVPLTNGLVSQLFGTRWLSTLFGLVFMGHQLGACLGIAWGARLQPGAATNDDIWLAAVALGVVAAALHWLIDDRPVVPATPARALSVQP